MVCYSCGKPKSELTTRKSSLLSGINLLLCKNCIESKYEPRWIIILAGRKSGPEKVRDYILKNRYVGKEISASELIS
jgi:NMD protein affecting ribosome stability and mRNA decay